MSCTSAVKMALLLLDYLFDRDTQAMSNVSGTGKLGKHQLDPLLMYGIQCKTCYVLWLLCLDAVMEYSDSDTTLRMSVFSLMGQYCFADWRLSSSSGSVTLHGRPASSFTRAGRFTHAGQAMTSCRLQSNHSSTVTLQGGPVVLRPARATPC